VEQIKLKIMTLEDFQNTCSEYIDKYPELKQEILDIYTLCLDEIEEGGSVQHEISLGMTDLEELINENS
jgi:hypothetical protein